MKLYIEKTNILDGTYDAIVNAANSELQAGGGVCGDIFEAAGRYELQKACNQIGGCKTGHAAITPGFNTKAKFIIHAVGPVYRDESSNKYLSKAYYNSLKVAGENGVQSIAFPSISTGIFHFPKEIAAKLAIKAIKDYFINHPETTIKEVTFCLLDDKTYNIFLTEAQLCYEYFEEEIIAVIDATRSIDFAVRPFYMMYLKGDINRKQLEQRLSLFGISSYAFEDLSDKKFREIIDDLDDVVEKSLSAFDLESGSNVDVVNLHEFWRDKVYYPNGCYGPEPMNKKLDQLYYGKPPVCVGMNDIYYYFNPIMISRKTYNVDSIEK